MEKTKTTELLTHMLDRLTDNEIATSDIKDMLVKLNATIQEVVQVLDIVIGEDAHIEQESLPQIINGKSSITKYIISEYYREHPQEAEELFEELSKQKVLYVQEIGES